MRLLILFCLLCSTVFGQSPRLINYQGLLRNAAGVPIANRTLTLKFEFRAGTPGGTAVFTEQQPGVTTNLLGLFNTQIGKINSTGMQAVNWQNGPVFLNVAVDTSGAGNFTELGTQQMVSVPYALIAETVPSSINGNMLTIGNLTHTLQPGSSFTGSTGIAVNGSVITNSLPDQPVVLNAGNSNISITSAYPDFTITSTPQLNSNGNELSISNGNTVILAPSLSINSNTLTVGPPGNTIALPAGSIPVIVGEGIATVPPPQSNSFTVSVKSPTFTGTGATSITGTWPNLLINSPTLATQQTVVAAAGIATVSPGPNFTIGVQTPSFTSTGATSVTGTWPNLVVNSPASGITQTVVAAPGIASVSPGPNFTVGVQTPSFTSTGATSITGTWPNLVVNSPAPGATQTVVAAPGIATVSPGPNFTVGVQTPSFTSTGATSITGTWPNLVVNSPTLGVTQTLVAAPGIASVSPGPNFTVGVQTPSFTSTGATSITGTWPNLVVSSPTLGVTQTVVAAPGIASVSPGPNFTVGVQTPSFTSTGATSITGTWPNLTVNSPTVSPAHTIVAAPGIATVSPGPNFTVGVQTPSFTSTGATSITGTYPNLVVQSPTVSPQVTVSAGASGIVSVSPGPNFVVSVQHPSFTSVGMSTITGTHPNYVVTTPVPPTPTVIGQGWVTVTPSTGISFTASVPAFSYDPATGELTSGTNSVLISPPVTYTNNILKVGPASNSVLIAASPWQQGAGTVTLTAPASKVGIGTSSPAAPLDITSTSTVSGGQAVNVAATSSASSGANSAVNADLLGTNAGNYISGYFRVEKSASSTGNATALKGLGVSALSGNGSVVGVDGIAMDGNDNTGLYGAARGGAGSTNYGLYATTIGTAGVNWAGWFQGDAAVNGKLSMPGQSSVPTANAGKGTLYYDQTLNKFRVSENGGAYVNLVESGWRLKGNSGTSSTSDFIGTTDAQNLVFRTNNTSFMELNTNGYLQLGISGLTAQTKLDIVASESVTSLTTNGGSPGTTIRILNSSQTNNNFSSITFPSQLSNGGTAEMAKIAAVHVNHTVGSNQGDLAFLTNFGVGGIGERMRLTGHGRLGLNTTAPTATLQVNGTTRLVDGTEGAGKVLTSDNLGNASWQTPAVFPPGMVMAYAGTLIPSGWVLCDGRSLLRTSEPALFNAIGTAWGFTSSTTFNVPDMQGMFLRGVANGSANDPDRSTRFASNAGGNTGDNVGSEQGHQLQSHLHNIGGSSNATLGLGGAVLDTGAGAENTAATGGTETRPKNVYVYYIIKL